MKSTPSRRAPAAINPRDVTAVILARNEAENLPLALESLPADMPVLVIDHESSDATAHIASAAGARVVRRAFDGFVKARVFALAQVQTPWTFMIDADERVDERLRAAIRSAAADVNGYDVARTTLYRGKALRMWRGERVLRLFRTAHARISSQPAAGGEAELHERWHVDGVVPLLEGTLVHDSYPTASSYAQKFEEYTATEACGIRPSRAKVAVEAMKTPLRFAWYAAARGAALDGADGLRVAWASARYPLVVQWKARRLR